MDAVVLPVFQEYEYGEVPPVAEAVAPPSVNPLQLTLLSTMAEETSIAGSVTVNDFVAILPFRSVMVTVYVPAPKLDKEAVVAAVDHA